MRLFRALLAVMAIALLTCVGMPTANSQTIDCRATVSDHSAVGLFDQLQVAAAVKRLHAATDDNIEVYVHSQDMFTAENPTSVYDQRLRESCNPATDYILIALDNGAYANMYYGSHFDRLTPVMNGLTKRFMNSFYTAGNGDQTAAVVELLDGLTTMFEQNVGYANYVAYPNGFIAVGPTSDNGISSNQGSYTGFAILATPTGVATILCLVVAIVGTVMLARDERDHSHR